MKKVLSLFLAVLMVLSCMAVSVYAEEGTTSSSPYFGTNGAAPDQAVLQFNLNNGKCKAAQYVYDTASGNPVWTAAEDVPNVFVIVPVKELAGQFKEGNVITLPSVKAPKGYDFQGWKRQPSIKAGDTDDRIYSSAVSQYEISEYDVGMVVNFSAVYAEGEVEEDTFAKVFEILSKIFGTIIGLIAYNGNTQAGIDFVNSIFSSIAG